MTVRVDSVPRTADLRRDRDFLAGGGEMGARMRATDWAATPLGDPAAWPQSLRTTVSTCLNSRFPILIWWGPELVMLYNDAYRPMLGASKHPAALGQAGHECWPEIWDIIGPMLHGVLARGEATWSEDQLLLLERNGYPEECYFTFSYSPIRDESGGVGGVFCAVTETSERVLGERRLAALRELATRTSECASVDEACRVSADTLTSIPADVPFSLIYLLDENGHTARLAGATGLAAGSAASPLTIELAPSHADDLSGEVWPLSRVATNATDVVVETLDGPLASLPGGPWPESPRSAMVLPIARSGQQSLAGFLVVGVNPRHALDESYRTFFELLARQIATAVANARSREDERKRVEALAELDRAKTAFFSNVSHEFRTPLTLLLGPLEDALSRPDAMAPDAREELDIAHRNALRLLKLVNSLLDFSRIEAGRVEASYEPVDLATYTAELASTFRSAIEKAGLSFVVDTSPLVEPVYVDRDMWEKVVLNLLSNAFKHTFAGEIAVTMRARDGHAELIVRDTGVGIAAEQLPHIFERFHRVPNARSRTYEGTGIGLALVQELVRLHGGQVTVTSEEDAGSIFTVRLPFGTAHLPPERIGAARTRTSTATGATPYAEEALRWLPERDAGGGRRDAETARAGEVLSPEAVAPPASRIAPPGSSTSRLPPPASRILVVDDNADMRGYVARMLGELGTVGAVSDGAAALQAVHEWKPDLVLADVMMPGLDGFELLRALRDDATTREIPVVLLSARAGEEARIEGLAAGADDYLVKPFSARELLSRVGTALALSRVRKETAAMLRESAERLRVSVETARMGTWETEIATRTITCSERNLANFGRAPGDRFTQDDWLASIHPDDRERVQRSGQLAIESNGEYEEEYRCIWPDGSLHWILSRGSVLYENDGTPRRMLGATLDITERKRTEQLLTEQKRLLEMIATGRQLDECLAALCTTVPRLDPRVRAAVLVADDERRVFKRPIAPELRASFSESLEGVEIGETAIGTCGVAVYTGTPVTCVDIAHDERWGEAWRQLSLASGIRACHSTPVFDRDGVTRASFMLAFAEPHAPTEWEYRLADFGAHVASIALARAHTEEALRASEARLAAELADAKLLQHISAQLIHQADVDTLYQGLVDAAMAIMHSDCASMQVLHPERGHGGELRLLAFRGFTPEAAAFWEWVRLDSESSCGTSLRTGERTIVPDVEACDGMAGTDDLVTYRQTGIRAVQTTPLLSRSGQLLGMLSTHWREPHVPSERDLRIFDILVRQAADLIERRRADAEVEAARREAEIERGRLAALVAQAPAAISVLRGPEHVFELANRHYHSFIGNRDVIGKPIRDALPELEGQGIFELLDRVYRTGEPFGSPELGVMLDHEGNGILEERFFNFVYQPIREADGTVSGIFVHAIDVTEQVHMRLAAERLQHEAEAARRAAEQANRAKSEFLAAMSHELRTPLNAIAGYLQLVTMGIHGPISDAQRTALDRAQKSQQHLLSLINDVLNFAKLEAGRVEYRDEDLRLADVVAAITPMIELQLAAKGVAYEVRVSPDVMVRADRDKVQQILLNLLSNAAKFTDMGGRVIVEMAPCDGASADSVCLAVTDTGIGIPTDKLESIFDPFVQVNRKLTHTTEGTGLGLAISRDLARGMGGDLRVRSTEGEGSIFTLLLRAPAPRSSPPPRASRTSRPDRLS